MDNPNKLERKDSVITPDKAGDSTIEPKLGEKTAELSSEEKALMQQESIALRPRVGNMVETVDGSGMTERAVELEHKLKEVEEKKERMEKTSDAADQVAEPVKHQLEEQGDAGEKVVVDLQGRVVHPELKAEQQAFIDVPDKPSPAIPDTGAQAVQDITALGMGVAIGATHIGKKIADAFKHQDGEKEKSD